jgi:putative salt-induced outer membrane protein YdiY
VELKVKNKIFSAIAIQLFMAVSFTVSAVEMPDANISGDVVRDVEDSQSDEEQTAAASNESAPEGIKAWLPTAEEYDWIQLTSNEWLKGKINGMYKDSLEFDSDKLDLLEIDWGDVKILRSSRVSDVNIEGIGATSGILEVMEGKIRISNDYEDKTYDRSSLISFAPAGKKERDLWSIKATLSFDAKKGNTDQLDYTAKLNMKRRSSTTRFLLDYIGNISKTNGGDGSLVETINNHRLNAKYDYYKTRYFFYTPAYVEYYRDPFSNIDSKITLATGLGYTLIDDGVTELSLSGGPAYVRTRYISVAAGESDDESSPGLWFKTNYDTELTKTIDFIAKYNIQYSNKETGGYTHHIILTINSEITGALDFDTSFIWDRTAHPTEAADGTAPFPDDYRITLGISYTY